MDVLKKTLFGTAAGLVIGLMQFSIGSIRKSRETSRPVTTFNEKFPHIQKHSDLHFCLMELEAYSMYDSNGALEQLNCACEKMMSMCNKFNNEKSKMLKEDIQEFILFNKELHHLCSEAKRLSEDAQTTLISGRPSDHKVIVDAVQLIQKITDNVWYNIYMETDVLMSEK